MPESVKIWENEYKDVKGFIDLGSCSGLANSELHELYAFPSIHAKGHFEVGARFGINGDYASMGTYSMGGPDGLAEMLRVNREVYAPQGPNWYLEIYEAHTRLYETDAWKDAEHIRAKRGSLRGRG